MGLLTDLASAAAAIYGFDQGIQDVKDVGSGSLALSQTLGDQAASRSRFKPFAISSSVGSVDSTDGVTNLTLGPEALAAQQRLAQQSGTLFDRAAGSTDDREAANFAKIEALLNPGRQRDRLGLEERLFNQGRSGVSTANFGGTPEQLALEQAIAESGNRSAVDAIGLARGQQAQDLAVGQGLFGAGVQIDDQLLKLLQGATGVADLQSTADRTGATLFSGLAEQGLESKIQSEAVAGNLQQQQIQAISQLLAGSGQGEGATQGILDQILGLLNNGGGS